MELGRIGVWWSGGPSAGLAPDDARAVEDLGYGTVWSSGRQEPGIDPGFAAMLSATDRLVVASGVVNIWQSRPEELTAAYHAIEDAHPGRFLLGIGVSHPAFVGNYRRPYAQMVAYLDRLDAVHPAVPVAGRVLAALGPRMLDLAGRRSAGAHPYFVPVEHTGRARAILGPGPLLAPEVTVALESDPGRARALARTFTAFYLTLPNYADNLRSLGFPADELTEGGSDRVVDAVVAWGDAASVAERVRAHLDAGADHVCIQVLSPTPAFPRDAYAALSAELG